MISSAQIIGYRGFKNFGMSGLGRINLLVGTNNSGKTSVLESIYLLASQGDPGALWQLLWRRGERLTTAAMPGVDWGRALLEVDISHLFNGHQLQPGATFRIFSDNNTQEQIEFRVQEIDRSELAESFSPRTTKLDLVLG